MRDTPFDLSGRTALVSGASGGLGQRFARTLHAAGATIVLTGRDPEHPRLVALERELDGADAGSDAAGDGSARCVRLALEVRDAASIEALFDALAADGTAVDILVNNAGVAGAGAALELDTARWDAVHETNLRGPFLLARRFARVRIEAGGGGCIVNVGSILGHRVGAGTAAYAAAKAGLVHLTRSLALEWARHGIRVNSLSPGYVLTDMNRDFFATEAGARTVERVPQRRIGEPADLDGALLLLASDASRYMTGSDLVVDGGHLCSGL